MRTLVNNDSIYLVGLKYDTVMGKHMSRQIERHINLQFQGHLKTTLPHFISSAADFGVMTLFDTVAVRTLNAHNMQILRAKKQREAAKYWSDAFSNFKKKIVHIFL